VVLIAHLVSNVIVPSLILRRGFRLASKKSLRSSFSGSVWNGFPAAVVDARVKIHAV
jgi:hypothetical protein